MSKIVRKVSNNANEIILEFTDGSKQTFPKESSFKLLQDVEDERLKPIETAAYAAVTAAGATYTIETIVSALM
ncbi:MAG: hypothetical protein CMO01_15035 [Thalassobius sp.]|nr:hypothetical protein [Thalassovita sp.]